MKLVKPMKGLNPKPYNGDYRWVHIESKVPGDLELFRESLSP